MNARDLVELAALVSSQGPALVRAGGEVSPSGIDQYWTASKARLDRWGRSIRDVGSAASSPVVRGVIEEILAAEVLARVWTGVLISLDRRPSAGQLAALGRTVLTGHHEARQWALSRIVQGPGVSVEEAVALNRLRRRCERWTDLLIGHLLDACDVSEQAFDPDRAREFADDLRREFRASARQHTWKITLISLRAAFRDVLSPVSPNPELNAQVAAGIIACFPHGAFDSTGVIQSLWMLRLANTANDAQGMIDELLSPQDDLPASAIGPYRRR